MTRGGYAWGLPGNDQRTLMMAVAMVTALCWPQPSVLLLLLLMIPVRVMSPHGDDRDSFSRLRLFNYYTELVITPMLFFRCILPLDSSGMDEDLIEFMPPTAVKISRAAYSGAPLSLIWSCW
jgi:hypothetical protein